MPTMLVDANEAGFLRLASTFDWAARWMIVSMSCLRRQAVMSSAEVISPSSNEKFWRPFSNSVLFKAAP